MEGLKPPTGLSFEGNLAANWKKWKQNFEIYMTASGATSKPEETKIAILLHVIGEDAVEKYNTFDLSDEDRKKYNKVLEEFEKYCLPLSNESVDRHIFFSKTQQPGETFDEFLTQLKKLSLNCGFGELKDSLIKDRIISGIADKNLKDRLLREGQLTLDKCIKMCKSSELAEIQLKTLNDENKVDAIKIKKNWKQNEKGLSTKIQKNEVKTKPKHIEENPGKFHKICKKCGSSHALYNCPAFNKVCLYCKKRNHFAKMCFKRRVNYISNEHVPDSDKNSKSSEEYVLGAIKSHSTFDEWVEKLKINLSKYLYVKLDTGAQCNVLPFRTFKKLKLKEHCMKNTQAILSNYNGSKIDVVGKCILNCETKSGLKSDIEFQIVNCEDNVPAVLGLKTIQQLGLIKRIDAVKSTDNYKWISQNYDDLFKGVGQIADYEYEIKLKEGATGTIEPCRRVPLSLMNSLKQELSRMEHDGIIRKVNHPTEFVNSLVIVRKPDGSLRVCLDPQRLNENILREHFHIKTFEEITSKMSGAKVFSILDANRAFWQVKLSDSSSDLTTFNTPFGRYCFLKMPYGINSAPEVFHKCFTEIFGEIEGVEIYIDDILIWGENKETHDKRLKQVLDKAREKNVKFNYKKCKFGINEVKYMGHTFSKEGLKPDEDKVKAILDMKTPMNVKELESFLGMITYVSRFIPNVSEKTAVLRDLLRKNVIWQWNHEHEEAFNNLKKILVDKPVLQYFDCNSPITLSVDASQSGLGAVLLQNNLPVAYGSRSLTDTQKNYAQIEKETLAIVFGCEKFNHYVFGNHFIVESDHKPLEAIFKKPLNKCPLRLQRMRIRLQPYNFTIKYRPGKELAIADALSRSFNEEKHDSFEEEIEAHVCMIHAEVIMSPETEQLFLNATRDDEELQTVLKLIRSGWPNNKAKVPDKAKAYFHFREELTEMNGLVFKNSCVVVPKSLRKLMLERIHYNHMGIEKCKQRAREILFWPGMNKEIEDLILNCSTCLKYQKHNVKEPLMPKEVPNRPWETLGTDLFYLNGKNYLIVIDYFSKFVEIGQLQEITSTNTIKLLKSMFARFGIPKLLYSDNGPQYSSKEFRKFVKEWNFEHKTSSPEFAQSNGMAERYIQTVKKMLLKAEADGKDQYLVLLEYRNTPISKDIPSPSEILFGKKLNGLLPIKESFEQVNKNLDIRNKLLDRQETQKFYFDRGSKELEPLSNGDNVFLFKSGSGPWENAKVLSSANRPRSYKILKPNGNIIERNRRALLKGPTNMKFHLRKSYVQNDAPDDDSSQGIRKEDRQEPKVSAIPDAKTSSDKLLTYKSPQQNMFTRTGRLVKKPTYLRDFVTF